MLGNFFNPPTPSDTDTPPCKAINIHPSSASNPHHNRAALRNSHGSFSSCCPFLVQLFPIRHRKNSPWPRRLLRVPGSPRETHCEVLRACRRLSPDRLNRFPGLQWRSSFGILQDGEGRKSVLDQTEESFQVSEEPVPFHHAICPKLNFTPHITRIEIGKMNITRVKSSRTKGRIGIGTLS